MKFAHLADCHIGGWREEALKKIGIEAFQKAIDICIQEKVGFVLIAGDLFNTSLPQIDLIKDVAAALSKLKEHNIDCYLIPGSHDYSPSGKTMLDVLDKAGLCTNVFLFKDGKLEFTVDKTNTKITGVIGLRGGLDTIHYQTLDKKPLEDEQGFKIFMFHTLLSEYKPAFLDMIASESVTSLPKHFHYYAGGHPHFVFQKKEEGYGWITYPGPLFPNNFSELERLKHGGFYIVDDKLHIQYVPVKIKEVVSFVFAAEGKDALRLHREILDTIKKAEVQDKIVTLRVHGMLETGKPSDINFKEIHDAAKGCYILLKNTYALSSQEFAEVQVASGTVDDIELKTIEEHLGQLKIGRTKEQEKEMFLSLLSLLNLEKQEGETNNDFEIRLMKDVVQQLALEKVWHHDS